MLVIPSHRSGTEVRHLLIVEKDPSPCVSVYSSLCSLRNGIASRKMKPLEELEPMTDGGGIETM